MHLHDFNTASRKFQQRLKRDGSARAIGFRARDGDVSRFIARYRLAASYRCSTFDGLSSATVNAYSAMIGLLLAWSAFEQLALICGFTNSRGLDYRSIDALFDASADELTESAWKDIRPFLGFLAGLTNRRTMRTVLEHAAAGGRLTPRQITVALRNAFAHGALTAHFGGATPRGVVRACQALSEHLLRIQAAHFTSVVNS